MDLFHHRYYRLLKIFLTLIGLWPYQCFRVRVLLVVVTLFVASSILVPQVTAIVKHLSDRDFIVECALSLIFNSGCFTKMISSIFNIHKMLKLLNHMRTDWEVWGRDCDVDILHEYAEKGRKMTILYAVMFFTMGIIFVSQPVMPKIIDFLLKNDTMPGQFPVPVDYNYIDIQKYYIYVIMHITVCVFTGILLLVACESMLMVYVQHGCGLFAILRCKLERLGRNQMPAVSKNISYGSDKPLMVFEYLCWCIDKHNHAIKYAELIDSTYSWCFFFIVALNMIQFSIEGVQIVDRVNEPEITIKLICCFASAMVHLYIESYLGQILMDHSISIRSYITNGKWYVLPVKGTETPAVNDDAFQHTMQAHNRKIDRYVHGNVWHDFEDITVVFHAFALRVRMFVLLVVMQMQFSILSTGSRAGMFFYS